MKVSLLHPHFPNKNIYMYQYVWKYFAHGIAVCLYEIPCMVVWSQGTMGGEYDMGWVHLKFFLWMGTLWVIVIYDE